MMQPNEPTRPDVSPHAERRRTFRLRKQIAAHLLQLDAQGNPLDPPREWRMRVIDISAGGFRASHGFSLGQRSVLLARLFVDPSHPVQATCHVVWEKHSGYSGSLELGFEFDDVPRADWERLVAYIVEEQVGGGSPPRS